MKASNVANVGNVELCTCTLYIIISAIGTSGTITSMVALDGRRIIYVFVTSKSPCQSQGTISVIYLKCLGMSKFNV